MARQTVTELRQALALKELELQHFKTRVRDKALEVAQDQGWCREGLRETLDELDLEMPSKLFTVTARIDVDILVDLSEDDNFMVDDDPADYIRSRIIDYTAVEVQAWSGNYDVRGYGVGEVKVEDAE